MRTPVLLDIWPPWCGPCKQLGPLLEKLETAYAGRFALAKLDSDAQPEIAGQLSQAFGVRPIPFCVMFVGGQPVDGFVGALPEAQIRAFLDKHVPSPDELAAEEEAEEAEQLAAEGDTDAALAKLAEALAIAPHDDAIRADYVKRQLEAGRSADARRVWEPLAPKAIVDARASALGLWFEACEGAAADGLRWQRVSDHLLIAGARTNMIATKVNGRFIMYTRDLSSMFEVTGGRALYRSESEDFLNWTRPRLVLAPDFDDEPDVRIGDRVTLRSPVWAVDLDLRIVGEIPREAMPVVWVSREYLDQAMRATHDRGLGIVNVIWVRASDPERVNAIMQTVDDLSRNSSFETASETEKSFFTNSGLFSCLFSFL